MYSLPGIDFRIYIHHNLLLKKQPQRLQNNVFSVPGRQAQLHPQPMGPGRQHLRLATMALGDLGHNGPPHPAPPRHIAGPPKALEHMRQVLR
jgi:hypothetical protein